MRAHAVTKQSVSLCSLKTSIQDDGHVSVLEMKNKVWKLDRQINGEMELDGRVFRCSSPFSRGVLDCKGGGKVSIHYNAEPTSVEMLMKPIASVNQLGMYGALLIWFGRRREGDNVAPNTNLNIAQNLVTNITRHENHDLFDLALMNRSLRAPQKQFS